MAYNFNPNFRNHFNNIKRDSKFMKRLGENDNFNYKPANVKMKNFISNEEIEENPKYKLSEIDNPEGWDFNQIDILGEMGFKLDDDYTMCYEISVPTLEEDVKIPVKVFKDSTGYVLEMKRKYVFETFDKMMNFIDSVPMKGLKQG